MLLLNNEALYELWKKQELSQTIQKTKELQARLLLEKKLSSIQASSSAQEIMKETLDINFWRAPVDNDFGAFKVDVREKDSVYFNWRNTAADKKLISFTKGRNQKSATKNL